MRTLTVLLLTSVVSFAGTADILFQGTPTRQYISFWTPDGYQTAEIRKLPVPAIRVEDENGRVVLDTYFNTRSSRQIFDPSQK
jgi:hypothetical protein